MAHEILSVKLCELEDQLSRLSSRIHLSETAGHERLQKEIKALAEECTETELTLQNKLQLSHTEIVSILADAYKKISQLIQRAEDSLQTGKRQQPGRRGRRKDSAGRIRPGFCRTGSQPGAAAFLGGD